MVDVLLKQLTPTALTYHAKNIQTLDISLDQPVMPFALPESDDTQAQIIKFEGNIMMITFSWMLLESDVDLVDGTPDIKTVEEQRDFLLNAFQSKGIDYKFEFELEGVTPVFKKEGMITKMIVRKSGDDPVQYIATASFTGGTVIVTAADS